GLPYPQGPRVDELAERGQAEAAPLTIAAPGRELFFSYSGLKTQALVALGRLEEKGVATTIADDAEPPAPVLDLLAGFRAAAVGQLLDRLARLHRRRPIPLLAVSGGVAANRLLRRALPAWCAEREIALRLVPLPYCGDNAAMIAWAAEQRHARGLADDPLAASAASRLAL
ncbi:MAG TPA: hypothetical protein PLV66_14855, partial [Thermoanaerobaculales bacterium]|nr:hypothetical protein [Thermoanaerobaculales bacterium]